MAQQTLGAVMRRPRWIAGLLLALLAAAALGALAQWQFDRAIESGTAVPGDKDELLPLTELQDPQMATTSVAAGHRVTVTGDWVIGQDQLIADRINDGENGYWVVRPFVVAGTGATLAVARGWTASPELAQAVSGTDDLGTEPETRLTGRFLPTEAPRSDDAGDDVLSTMSTAALVNSWTGLEGRQTYSGYLILEQAPDGLETIIIAAQGGGFELNWLNIFYAIEWLFFAGGAVYLWYRLAKDEWMREAELAELLAEQARIG